MRIGRLTIRDKQIILARDGVESVIAHCIAQNIEKDPGFPVHWYVDECRAILVKTSIPAYLVDDILDEAEDRGIHEKAPESGGAAQLHPEYNHQLLNAVDKLNKLFLGVK